MPKILRRLRINEVSSVTRGAGEGVKIMLMKVGELLPYVNVDKTFNGSELDDDALAYIKREFSSEQRRSAAESGAALPDGSFPIHNKSDLHNAMRAIGRAKDPAKAKAHIRRRAKALGLTGELSDAFKGDVPYSERVATFFTDLFKRKPERNAAEGFDQAVAGLAESVKSIMDDDDGDVDRDDMLAKTFTQFHEHVSTLIGGPAPPRQPTDKKEDDPMSAQLLKALGLKDDASEEDALKAVAELTAKAKRERDNGDEDEDEEDEEDEDEERKKAMKVLPASIRKMIEEGRDAQARVKKLEADAALAGFVKQCAEIGLPETHATTLQKAYGGDKAAVDELLKLTKTGFAAAKAAGAFKEFGAPGNNGAGASAFDQFTALAKQYLKEHPGEKLTHEQAFSKVYQDPAHKDLRILEARESGRAQQ